MASSAPPAGGVMPSTRPMFAMFEPMGLFGIYMRIKRYFLAWPFRY